MTLLLVKGKKVQIFTEMWYEHVAQRHATQGDFGFESSYHTLLSDAIPDSQRWVYGSGWVGAAFLAFFQANAARNACTMEAPASAVMPEVSLSGKTSTRSIPTVRQLRQTARNRLNPCREVKPSTSGVPVPGAWDASRKSMSKLMYTGLVPTRWSTSAAAASVPVRCSSSPVIMRNPCFRGQSRASRLYSGPRIPICVDFSGRINPSCKA